MDLNFLSSFHGTGLCVPLHYFLYFSKSVADRKETENTRIFHPDVCLVVDRNCHSESQLAAVLVGSPTYERSLLYSDTSIQKAKSLLLRVSEIAG